jgi:hypothetical protein
MGLIIVILLEDHVLEHDTFVSRVGRVVAMALLFLIESLLDPELLEVSKPGLKCLSSINVAEHHEIWIVSDLCRLLVFSLLE